MTVRNPRDPRFLRGGPTRDPTQPPAIDNAPRPRNATDDLDDHPSLASGTGDEGTRVESPGGRVSRDRKPPPHAKLDDPRARSAAEAKVQTGDEPEHRLGAVLGTYRLLDVLGKGGMGFVYRAEHIKLGREVALKVLRADYARRRDAVNRFFQEAKTVNRVRHRNIVDVTDFVELPDGTTFIIMELLGGQSLGKWARTGIDLPRALAVLVQICDGLGAAHAVGVIHRDLKPDNVVVTPTTDGGELVKLLDFGVAKLVNRDDEDVGFQTAAGAVIGTPAYMSPEQAGGMAIDPRSDIYSLGAIMYELFCGQPLFRGRSFGEYVRKHLTEAPLPPRQTAGGANISDRLEAVILRCLAKEPDTRYGHILELRDELLQLLGDPYASHVRTAFPMALPLAPPMQTTMPTPPHPSQASHLYSASHPSYAYATNQPSQLPSQTSGAAPLWPWLVGGAAAVAIGVGGALWYTARAPVPRAPAVISAAPIAMATTPAATSAAPAAITLHFDSLPSGGVYADGHATELCRTPCALDVTPADGAQRRFVVRSDGYADQVIDVDLGSPVHEFHVTLDRVAAPAILPRPASTPAPSKAATAKHVPVKHVEHAEHAEHAGQTPAPAPHSDGIIDPANTHDPFKHD